MRLAVAVLALVCNVAVAPAQKTVSFPTQDGGTIFADLYGSGPRGLVLAHGGQFNKESWRPQAERFAATGFFVLALDFRGYGNSRGPGQSDLDTAPLHLDVLAAVRYLRAAGAQAVSVVGASMGASAAADASIHSAKGEIDRIVLLSEAPDGPADQIKSPTLWIIARDDSSGSGPRLPRIRAQYDRAPQPKRLILLDGSAHAQFLFATSDGERVMREILGFLTPKSRPD
ncbi:MAG TPA: alpha/beta fold hydrolase [Terracidiphilus sp.]|nr:alpha/beta fold hydrolase [Terracidiphilus sp.]